MGSSRLGGISWCILLKTQKLPSRTWLCLRHFTNRSLGSFICKIVILSPRSEGMNEVVTSLYPSISSVLKVLHKKHFFIKKIKKGTPGGLSQYTFWHMTSAQVMISRFGSSSPISGSVLPAQSLLGILSPSLSLPCFLSISLKINKNKGRLGGAVG